VFRQPFYILGMKIAAPRSVPNLFHPAVAAVIIALWHLARKHQWSAPREHQKQIKHHNDNDYHSHHILNHAINANAAHNPEDKGAQNDNYQNRNQNAYDVHGSLLFLNYAVIAE
jgi:hypothetical protein